MGNNKIAIMTWYTYNNYGSVLQAYALKEKIKELGYDKVDFVNYIPKPSRISIFKRVSIKNIKSKLLLKKINNKNSINEKEYKFNEFRKQQFSLSIKCKNATELFQLNNIYDKFVCGSDQIWAPTVYDENYFLNFVSNNRKKIAYAPSIGLNQIANKNIREKMNELVNKIDSLSIREEQGKAVIKSITGRTAEVVLDPTLLLNKTDWDIKFKLKENKGNYLVYYCLNSNKSKLKIAKIVAKKLGLELRIIPTQVEDYCHENIENCSPQEFLKLIYNSSMVITDSFHGTIFSINFNIPFIVYKRFKDNKYSQNSRIYNILKKVNLEKRIYNNNIKYFINNSNIDFKNVNKIIQTEREKSLRFLTDSLKKENSCNIQVITNRCTGCGVCELICPQNCIEIKLNKNGFYNYIINQDNCIHCNKCKSVCGQNNAELKYIQNMKLYSACSNNKKTLMNSSSGGIAHEISIWGIKNGYPIIGCIYDSKSGTSKHIKVDKYEDISKLDGSKYIQSFTKEGFIELKKINKGIVIGTPCQIASVNRYLNVLNKRDNFILIDLICHGVPSIFLWRKYLSKYKHVYEVKFRNKKYGWRNKILTINSHKSRSEKKDYFYHFFNTSKVNNEACYECKYRKKTSADIRIGDYWGKKFKNNKRGVSMVILATEKGENTFKSLLNSNVLTADIQNINDYFVVQQTENTYKPLEYETIISLLKDEKYSIRKLSRRFIKKDLRIDRLKKIILPIYLKMKDKLNG